MSLMNMRRSLGVGLLPSAGTLPEYAISTCLLRRIDLVTRLAVLKPLRMRFRILSARTALVALTNGALPRAAIRLKVLLGGILDRRLTK